MSGIINIGETEFEGQVYRNSCRFWSVLGPWCGPMQMIAPVLDELADYRGRLKILRLMWMRTPGWRSGLASWASSTRSSRRRFVRFYRDHTQRP